MRLNTFKQPKDAALQLVKHLASNFNILLLQLEINLCFDVSFNQVRVPCSW
jgi:hypothetical protein